MCDTNYWNTFYETKHVSSPSEFCTFVMEYFGGKDIKKVMDCGCGNGRDSYTLARSYNVCAVDNCGLIPLSSDDNLSFVNEDFVTIDKSGYDMVYSRFTFHSITNQQQYEFINTIPIGCYLAIETRSMTDEDTEFVHGTTHYRNLTDLKYVTQLLISNGFEIIYMKEDKNFAKYKDENPVCIRLICKRIN